MIYRAVILDRGGLTDHNILNDMRKLWEDMELGNDWCYVEFSGDEQQSELYPHLSEYLRKGNFYDDPNTKVMVHYWW